MGVRKKPDTSPKVKKKRKDGGVSLRWLLILVILGGLSVLAVFLSRQWTLEDIRVQGNFFTEQESVLNAANLEKGVVMDSLDHLGSITAIEALPYVRQARIIPAPPSSVIIEIEERKPIGLLFRGSERAYVDKEGVKLPVELGKAVDVPVVYGFPTSFKDTLQSTQFEAIRSVLEMVDSDPFLKATIAEITFVEDEGVIALTDENAVKLIFGKNPKEEQFRNWKAFYAQEIRIKGIQAFATLDFRYTDQIIATSS